MTTFDVFIPGYDKIKAVLKSTRARVLLAFIATKNIAWKRCGRMVLDIADEYSSRFHRNRDAPDNDSPQTTTKNKNGGTKLWQVLYLK